MKTRFSLSLAFAATLAAPYLPGRSQSASISVPPPPGGAPPPAAPASPLSDTEQFLKNLKNPTAWLSWGSDLRIRNEYYDNNVSITSKAPLSEQDVFRFRSRIWATATPVTNLTATARLSAEPREWIKPAFVGSYRGQTGMEWRYGIADSLFVKMSNVLDQPLTITAGRQDITIGDYWNWWLVADGTPLDGSWTYFLDSVRAIYDAKSLNTKFDFVYLYQNAYNNSTIPVINDVRAPLVEQREQGVILYASNRSVKNLQLDGFFMYKNDDQVLANGDNGNLYTLGTTIQGYLGEHWNYSLQGAYQFGEKQDPTVRIPVPATYMRDLSAYALNGRFSYLFRDKLNNQFDFVFERMSGDDPNTPGQDEMFDVLWGRWPRWSELYIYSYIQETSGKIAQLNNIQRLGVGWTFTPFKDTSFGLYYNALFAPQEVPTRTINAYVYSMDGNFRGHYLQAVLKKQFTKHLSGHLWAEFLWEGDYYVPDDLMTFLRAEITLSL